MLKDFNIFNRKRAKKTLEKVKFSAINNGNIFDELMEATKYCSLGEITNALFEVGGQYRRNM
jgi:methylmalonyl-CoA mutase